MTTWELHEHCDRWIVRRNGLWQCTAGAEAAWAYVAAHAGDDDPVQVRYVTGRSGPVLTGARVWELVEGQGVVSAVS